MCEILSILLFFLLLSFPLDLLFPAKYYKMLYTDYVYSLDKILQEQMHPHHHHLDLSPTANTASTHLQQFLAPPSPTLPLPPSSSFNSTNQLSSKWTAQLRLAPPPLPALFPTVLAFILVVDTIYQRRLEHAPPVPTGSTFRLSAPCQLSLLEQKYSL
jgi:hypothetical protein